MSIKAIRGFKDVLPDEIGWWQKVEKTAAGILENFGYKELRVPIVERTELFARSIGQDTDIVEKEMYSFSDRRGDSLTLRPEVTAGAVRALIEHNLAADGRPVKFYGIGPNFRYERPQKGRQRQFYQLNVEAYNVAHPYIDAEMIILWTRILEGVDLKDVAMHINSLGCPSCRPAYNQKLQNYLKDRLETLCEDCQRRYHTNPLRVLDCKSKTCAETVQDAPLMLDELCPECGEHFNAVQKALTSANVPYVVTPRLVRGLDYYTRTVFEAQTGKLGAQNAVGGGGRYDNLVKNLGGPDIAGIGFAMGMERLIMLLSEDQELDNPGPDLFMASLDDAALELAFKLANGIRAEGFRVEMEYTPASLKSRMKRAGKLGADWVFILGPDEMSRGLGILRNMGAGTQEDVPLNEAITEIINRMKKGDAV
ncbi:MAG: histidine--tRNA ligase [Deltaproteobacteria bacterium]|nr:histidine--tRNA ligase [Deltaproteobacteria bacterium]